MIYVEVLLHRDVLFATHLIVRRSMIILRVVATTWVTLFV